jgi:hypothetical protein
MRAGVQARSRCQRKACAVSGVELATERLLATGLRDLSGPDRSRAALGASGAPIPCDDWHRSIDRRRCNQDRHWRLDCARRYRLRGVAVKKVRLDRASGGRRRVEKAIVHELVEFGTISRDAQTF